MTRAASSEATEADSGSRLSSVTSALRLLKAFTADASELGITELAKRLGLAKSTVHRLASTLVAEGFLEQAEGRYRLTRACLEVLARARSPFGLITRGPLT